LKRRLVKGFKIFSTPSRYTGFNWRQFIENL
jgi:hypothetical protein